MEIEKIRVSSATNSQALAGSIAKVVGKGSQAEISAIGAGSINQCAKALAIARRMVSSSGQDLLVSIGWFTADLSDEGGKKEITGLVFRTVVR